MPVIVAFAGIRDLSPGSWPDVDLAVVEHAADADELRFGGARGADTAALLAACGSEARSVVYVPFRLRNQPREAQDAARKCADEIIEMRLPRSRAAYLRRNDEMLRGADRLVAFTDGRDTGGTAWTATRAEKLGVPIVLVPVLATGARENPWLRGDWSAPVYAWRAYVSAPPLGPRHDKVSDLIRRMKKGDFDDEEIDRLADNLAALILREPALSSAEAIVPMPRQKPGIASDLEPLASAIARITGQSALPDWLIRTEAPTYGGKVRARRLRFPPEEHARTMAVVGADRPRSIILLDNVLTFGGTMDGGLRAVLRDAPSVLPVGLAVLR